MENVKKLKFERLSLASSFTGQKKFTAWLKRDSNRGPIVIESKGLTLESPPALPLWGPRDQPEPV